MTNTPRSPTQERPLDCSACLDTSSLSCGKEEGDVRVRETGGEVNGEWQKYVFEKKKS